MRHRARSPADLPQRPRGVPAHQWFRVEGERTHECGHSARIAAIAERHAHVPQESRSLRAPNRASREQFREPRIVERQKPLERPAFELAGVQARLARRRSETIPRADVLADVAAEDPFTDQGPQLAGDGAAKFDREVGDAAARVDLLRSNDGLGRAGIDT